MDTLKSLAVEWHEGALTLEEAKERSKSLPELKARRDDDGEKWYDGDWENETAAVYVVLPVDEATEFLEAVSEARLER